MSKQEQHWEDVFALETAIGEGEKKPRMIQPDGEIILDGFMNMLFLINHHRAQKANSELNVFPYNNINHFMALKRNNVTVIPRNKLNDAISKSYLKHSLYSRKGDWRKNVKE
ncbi:MAG: hypothetical protein KGI25_09985 [Thaumarchaeota archaeon]|nr:hypothetical protein [Nitrososphaerota archaeon]